MTVQQVARPGAMLTPKVSMVSVVDTLSNHHARLGGGHGTLARERMDSEGNNIPLFANVPGTDPDVVAAVSEAKRTLPRFIDAVTSGRFSTAFCAVKVPFIDRSATAEPALVRTSDTGSEYPDQPTCHLWLSVTSVIDDLVFCSVFEAPDELRLKPGTSFVVASKSIEDWMINQGGEIFGGYSLQVIRNRLGMEARETFDAHTGIRRFKEVMP